MARPSRAPRGGADADPVHHRPRGLVHAAGPTRGHAPAALEDGADHLGNDLSFDHRHRRGLRLFAAVIAAGATARGDHRDRGAPDDLGCDAPGDPSASGVALPRTFNVTRRPKMTATQRAESTIGGPP